MILPIPATELPLTPAPQVDTSLTPAPVGLGSATLIVVALVVFMVQNTGSVDIRFQSMTGRTSLGLVLLIAVFGAVLLTVSLGTVRILQLRRLVNRQRG